MNERIVREGKSIAWCAAVFIITIALVVGGLTLYFNYLEKHSSPAGYQTRERNLEEQRIQRTQQGKTTEGKKKTRRSEFPE